jgi:hypothetical protein
VNSATKITAVVESGSSGSLTVTNKNGTGTFSGFNYTTNAVDPKGMVSRQAIADEEAVLLRHAVNIYPNPVDGQLYVQFPARFGEQVVTVYAVTGQRLLEAKLSSGEAIDVSRLNPGMYMLMVDPQKERVILRFVKQ